MYHIFRKIKGALFEKFDPDGNKTFIYATVGSATGPIFSEQVALLIDEVNGKLFLTHPELLNDSCKPLIVVERRPNGVIQDKDASLEEYPELAELYSMLEKEKCFT